MKVPTLDATLGSAAPSPAAAPQEARFLPWYTWDKDGLMVFSVTFAFTFDWQHKTGQNP